MQGLLLKKNNNKIGNFKVQISTHSSDKYFSLKFCQSQEKRPQSIPYQVRQFFSFHKTKTMIMTTQIFTGWLCDVFLENHRIGTGLLFQKTMKYFPLKSTTVMMNKEQEVLRE